jgi:hypothetical protein
MSNPNPYENNPQIPPTQYGSPQPYSSNPYGSPNVPPANLYAQPQGYAPQPGHGQGQEPGSGMALAGMILGIISLFAWLIAFVGIITSVVGLILSALGRRSPSRRGMATAGLVMSIIALVLALGNCALGIYFATQGGSIFY